MQSKESVDFVSGLEEAAPIYEPSEFKEQEINEIPKDIGRKRKISSRGATPEKQYIESRFSERFTVFMENDKTFKNISKEHII